MTLQNVLLRFIDIKKTYTTKQALKGINLEIFQGEIIGLLGVNGAGKSTLSSIVATLHPPTSGDIIYNNQSIYADLAAYRSIIGYCPQQPNLNSLLSLEDNLAYAGRYYGMSEDEISKQLEYLSSLLELRPYLKQKASVLSGGYKQRFMIARALMHNPKLVLFDEPTVGLDPHIRRQLWNIIKELKNQGKTVILTTHYLDEAEFLSDRICVLHQGSIILIDTPEKLKEDFKKNNLEEVFLQILDEVPAQ